MQIIDINGVERTIKAFPTVVVHVRKDVGMTQTFENVDGELVTTDNQHLTEVEEKYAEVKIMGNRSEWTEWYPLKKFEEMNPWFKEKVN